MAKYSVQSLRKRFLHPDKSNKQVILETLNEITVDVFEKDMLHAEIGFILEKFQEAIIGLSDF